MAENIEDSRTALTILGILYAHPKGRINRDELEMMVGLLDVENMTVKEWNNFKRKTYRMGKWHRTWLYKLLHLRQ